MKKNYLKKVWTVFVLLFFFSQIASAYTVNVSPAPNLVCSGDSVTFTATINGCANFSVQWYLNSSPVGTNSVTYNTGPLTAGFYSVNCTVSSSSCSGSPVVSNTITFTVTASVVPSVAIVANPDTICSPGC